MRVHAHAASVCITIAGIDNASALTTVLERALRLLTFEPSDACEHQHPPHQRGAGGAGHFHPLPRACDWVGTGATPPLIRRVVITLEHPSNVMTVLAKSAQVLAITLHQIALHLPAGATFKRRPLDSHVRTPLATAQVAQLRAVAASASWDAGTGTAPVDAPRALELCQAIAVAQASNPPF
jgi:hypothetical protein